MGIFNNFSISYVLLKYIISILIISWTGVFISIIGVLFYAQPLGGFIFDCLKNALIFIFNIEIIFDTFACININF